METRDSMTIATKESEVLVESVGHAIKIQSAGWVYTNEGFEDLDEYAGFVEKLRQGQCVAFEIDEGKSMAFELCDRSEFGFNHRTWLQFDVAT